MRLCFHIMRKTDDVPTYRETKTASVYQERLFTWNTKVSLNCGWLAFRHVLAWWCRRPSDGNSCSFASVTLPWHWADRLAAWSRDTTSGSLSCWYTERTTGEQLYRWEGPIHWVPLEAGTGLVLCCPAGTNLKNHIEQNEKQTVKTFSLYFLCIIVCDA